MNSQNTETPREFVDAVEKYFGITFGVDLAGSVHNSKALNVITEGMDSFGEDWSEWTRFDWGWLNPPFSNLTKWIEKCYKEKEQGAKFITIWPLSSDLNQIPVFQQAQVHLIHGRVWPLVRGCMLCRWEKGITPTVSGLRWENGELKRLW